MELSFKKRKIDHDFNQKIPLFLNNPIEINFSELNILYDEYIELMRWLKTNNITTKLIMYNVFFSKSVPQIISEIIKINNFLKEIQIVANKIDAQGCKIIAKAVKFSNSLVKLDMSYNEITDKGCFKIAKALKNNETLVYLNLDRNSISFIGCNELFEALKINKTLTELSLKINHIDYRSGEVIAETLKINTVLTILDFEHNCISNKGCRKIFEALKSNTTLHTLNMKRNLITEYAFKRIVQDFDINKTLMIFIFNDNQISHSSAEIINSILKRNKDTRDLKIMKNVLIKWLNILLHNRTIRKNYIERKFKEYYYTPNPVRFSDGSVRRYGKAISKHMGFFEENRNKLINN